ncbi:1-phosphofructokinase family hexose kinase [Niallia sp. NCCP-28]|uniref:1-phosphofructokinase family hexose kinase n=1 Tax=Niallia sp. NCCP-28 TaxID=2934712 RepID=UPI0020826FE4|nr:PfkB family carbohydrate kinase [Niallia sp. NCCP-28]GKU85147.1 tagatose-6-phosphate kinase [Niallia sp. NCCP-28]
MIHVVCPNPALDRTVFLKKFEINGVSRAQFSKDLLGGKGFNVIRSYLIKEKKSSYLIHTFLGGYTGQFLQTLIQKEKVDSIVTEINGTTRICSIVVDEHQKHAHLINESGPSIGKSEAGLFLKRLLTSVNAGDFVLFSGSLPEGLDQNFYAKTIAILEARGAKCVLDSSGPSLAMGIQANPWLIKVNELEFFELIGQLPEKADANSVEKALRELDSSSNFIVTLGGKGTLAKFENAVYKVALPKIEVKNATASGDIFLGGLTKSLHNGESIEKALQTASLYSLSNCLYWYPNIELSDVEYYESQIKVTKLGGLINETITG